MNNFAYRVYYEYNGPSHSDPFRSPKNSQEISDALSNFPNQLPHYLSDRDATVASELTKKDLNTIIVFVATVLGESAIDEAVKKCLNDLDLFGEKLKKV